MTTPFNKLIVCFLTVTAFLAFVQRDSDPLEKLVNAMHKWTDSVPQEKVYIHMDKPYYALGDTIWFKAYVTTGSRHQLSAISGALYVDLINEKDSIVSALKLPISAGMSMGNFILHDELNEGNYRVRAYTQWMRNAGTDYFFDHTLPVISPFENAVIGKVDSLKQFPIRATLSQSDIQFFPEGGSLIYGVVSRLAFKATGTDGNGVTIRGEIFDEEQHHIAEFVSGHGGMGNFFISPEVGKTYTAKVTFADGSQKSVSLPKPLATGYVLSVFQANVDSILVRIRVPEQLITGQQSIRTNCIVHSGGEIITALPVNINKISTSIWLDKKLFPSGISHFTLFSAEGEPLNERIAFIKRDDQLSVTLNTPKSIYKNKEAVTLQLEVKDSENRPIAGNFSITVIDETKTPFDEAEASTIFSNLLLTSDIKGYIEKPNYYFSIDNDEVNRDLDNLMLTQGYRRFLWSDLKSKAVAAPVFEAEGLGTYISGRVVTLGNKPAVNATVTLLSIKANLVKGTTTGEDGKFKFDGIFLADSLKFSIQARSQKNSSKLEVILDSVPKLNTRKTGNIGPLNTELYRSTKSYTSNTTREDEVLEKLDGSNRIKRLKEVTILAKAYEKNLPKQRNYNLNGPGKYDQMIKNEDLQACPDLLACLTGRITGVYFKDGLPYSTRASPKVSKDDDLNGVMMVVLNGVPLPVPQNTIAVQAIFSQNDPPTNQISSIEVLRSINYTNAYGPEAVNGVILITTTSGGNHKTAYNPNVVNFTPKNFNKAREFYSPRYDHSDNSREHPDLRSTIYWNPRIKTDINGKGTCGFFTADRSGIYKITIEGIDAEGKLGRQVYRFSVEAKN